MISRSVWDRTKILLRRQLRRFRVLLGKNPLYVPIITGFCLILLTFVFLGVFGKSRVIEVTPDSKIVIITHDGVKQIVPTNDKTVGDLLKRLNIPIHQGDVVQPALTTPINQDDFRINIYRAVPVEIVENGNVDYTFSAATTPRAIAEQSGAQVYAEDAVKTAPTENFLASSAIGQQVVIYPAAPISLDFYGTTLMVRTYAATVGDFIKQQNLHLSADDQVSPGVNTALNSSVHMSITRQGAQITSTTQSIPMPVQVINDPNLAYGTSSVVQQGSAGSEITAYQGTTPIQSLITQPTITEIVDEGTALTGIQGDMALAGIPASDYSYVDYIVSHESGWCPTKAQGEYGTCPPYTGLVPSYGGYGLCQATPGIKMESAGSDWATNPITQLEWCNGYAISRYGSWYNAYIHWIDNGNW